MQVQGASAVAAARINQPESADSRSLAPVVAFAIAPPRAPADVVSVARWRVQRDPPDSLFARRCLLLL